MKELLKKRCFPTNSALEFPFPHPRQYLFVDLLMMAILTEWMALENTMLSEISQSVKDKYRMILSIKGT